MKTNFTKDRPDLFSSSMKVRGLLLSSLEHLHSGRDKTLMPMDTKLGDIKGCLVWSGLMSLQRPKDGLDPALYDAPLARNDCRPS